MSEQLTQLQSLQNELHAANEALANSAKPLERLSEMSLEERQHLADQIRAGLARWESVTEQIAKVLGIGSEGGSR